MVLLCFRDTIYTHGFFKNKTRGGGGKLIFFIRVVCVMPFLVPVRRFASPSRSIRFGDVSEANGREYFRIDHVTRNALAARKNEA